jgi:tRNA(Ile)-lysidine synthase
MISTLAEKLFTSFSRGTLFVGFSGGADSTAALLTVLEWRASHPGCRVEAVHFDHHLRGEESAREAAAARAFAVDRGVPFRLIDLEVDDAGEGIEAAARSARLAEWKRLCGGRRDIAVVQGHHADDRVETMMLRLFRGGNATSLASPRPRASVDGVTFLRPLAEMSRADIETFLVSSGVTSWQTDSSNKTLDYDRNFWRNDLLPRIYGRFPWSRAGARRALEALTDDAEFIELAAEKFYDSGDAGSIDFWRAAHPALRPRLMRRFLREGCGRDVIPGTAFFERFEAALAVSGTAGPRTIPIRGGVALSLHGDRIGLERETPADVVWDWKNQAVLHWGAWRLERRFEKRADASGAECACFDAGELPETLVVGAPRPGERMIPFGREKSETLHKLRIDRGVGAVPPVPVLRSADGAVWWACMVRRSAFAKVAEGTRSAVCFYCIEAGEN